MDQETSRLVLKTPTHSLKANIQRRQVFVNGIVQGVGFRPFVYNSALRLGLSGNVANTSDGVLIEIEGPTAQLNRFLQLLTEEAPPLAVITKIESKTIIPTGATGFAILHSESESKTTTLISPDVAVCADCLAELFDPDDRRYKYPFINCTNCGPRYTIIEDIPYDRPFTSMRHFTMCPACQSEYDDPANRRFHAQPNACPACGPRVTLFDKTQTIIDTDDPIKATSDLLKKGYIVAIKGLGGFHLAADATNAKAVATLRERKGREEKPFAVMAPDIQKIEEFCEATPEEIQTLQSPQAPIVLMKKRENGKLADSIAPGNDRLGVMLPYTPLHHILLRYGFEALVMTSANYSEEPICIENEEAFRRLNRIADYFLTHDRDIYLRSDDSVIIYLGGKLRQIRRSRGYVPQPIFVRSEGPPILAVGGELKNTVCLLKGNQAIMSQHIGDLENLEAFNFFRQTIQHLQRIFDTQPELIAHDLHPEYLSTKWATDQNETPGMAVQHHHAHLAACLAENHRSGPAIGLIMDGTGYGADGTIWGGEVLIGDYSGFHRFGHFEPAPLPGGNAAIKAPWRTAVSYLYRTFGKQLPDLPFLHEHNPSLIIEMIEKGVNSPLTSSCGRLFDAIAVIAGGRQTIHYEAQSAIEFMQQCQNLSMRPFDYILDRKQGHWEILIAPIVRSVVRAYRNGESIRKLSGRFHKTLIEIFTEISLLARRETGISEVALSGGVFQNQVLFENLVPKLERQGFRVLVHSRTPTNDGGIALGQAMIGRQYLLDRDKQNND